MSESPLLPGIERTEADQVHEMTLDQRVERAIALLRDNVPPEGYYVAFSGGKDSCVIKELVRMSGVKHDCWYNQTTIDPPELVRFIKEHHADVRWNIPKHGNMMHRVAHRKGTPPTRAARWCCDEYKEGYGRRRIKVFGVRASESKGRALRWKEISLDTKEYKSICPIVHWTDDHVWDFIRHYKIPYCKLYDEGWTRLGCVGCPLGNWKNQEREFKRWPAFERNWKNAIIKNWEIYKDTLRDDGKPRFQAGFKTGEEFWNWWRFAKRNGDPFREDCQSGFLWTNDPGEEASE